MPRKLIPILILLIFTSCKEPENTLEWNYTYTYNNPPTNLVLHLRFPKLDGLKKVITVKINTPTNQAVKVTWPIRLESQSFWGNSCRIKAGITSIFEVETEGKFDSNGNIAWLHTNPNDSTSTNLPLTPDVK